MPLNKNLSEELLFPLIRTFCFICIIEDQFIFHVMYISLLLKQSTYTTSPSIILGEGDAGTGICIFTKSVMGSPKFNISTPLESHPATGAKISLPWNVELLDGKIVFSCYVNDLKTFGGRIQMCENAVVRSDKNNDSRLPRGLGLRTEPTPGRQWQH